MSPTEIVEEGTPIPNKASEMCHIDDAFQTLRYNNIMNECCFFFWFCFVFITPNIVNSHQAKNLIIMWPTIILL